MKGMKNEQGFMSGFVVLFVVTLTLMGVGGAILMKSEGRGVGSTMEAMQANYAVDSALWFACEAARIDTLDTFIAKVPYSIGDATITEIDTNYAGTTCQFLITAETNNSTRSIDATIQYYPGMLGITSLDNVTDIDMNDEDGDEEPQLIADNETSLPSVDLVNLQSISETQDDQLGDSLTISGDFSPPYDDWPYNTFYNPNDGNPSIVYIDGNFTVDRTINGIFIVTGDVYVSSGDKVYGIIYAPNSTSTVDLNGYSESVEGAIMCGGAVDGDHSFFFGNSEVRYNTEYVLKFMEYGNMDISDRVVVTSYDYN